MSIFLFHFFFQEIEGKDNKREIYSTLGTSAWAYRLSAGIYMYIYVPGSYGRVFYLFLQ